MAHKPPGFAFVFYKTVREAREAVKGADGRMVCGVRVRVRMGTEVNQSEMHQRRSFEREYDSPPRERNRTSSSYQARGYQQGPPRGSRHAERGSRNYEEHSPARGSPPARSGWSGRPSHRSMPRSHPSSVGHSHSSRSSHGEDLYSPPSSSSHGKYGGHKRSYDASSHYTPMSDRFISRESGSRVTSKHPYHTSPERPTKFSPPADIMYHGNKRGSNRFDHHEVEYNRYKDKQHRSRHKEHGYPKISPKISSHHHHRQHRSRSPHSFTPPPMRQHDRRHGNKSGWGHGNHSPPTPPPSRRPHYDDNRGYKERMSRSDEQFEAHGFSSDRGNRREFIFDGGRSDSSSRYGKSNDHSYKSADREVKYRGHQRYPSTERYAEEAEYNEPYIRQDRIEYDEHNRSDRGSSLEGVGVDDDFPEVRVERDPNDLRRKLLSEGDSEREVREAASSERG